MNNVTADFASEKFSLARLIALHLLPGLVITLGFVGIAKVTAPLGCPASLALLVTWPIVGIPLLLGLIMYQGYKTNGTLSLRGVLLYRNVLSFRQYAWIVLGLLLWAATAATLFSFLAEVMQRLVFPWWPAWLDLSVFAKNPAGYSHAIQAAIVALSAVLNIAIPIVEELYFRSYLLPRIPVGKRWAPLVSATLFSLYHFWLPWDFLGRIVALLPVVYLVQRKQNVYLSILVHCLLNSLGTIGLIVMLGTAGR